MSWALASRITEIPRLMSASRLDSETTDSLNCWSYAGDETLNRLAVRAHPARVWWKLTRPQTEEMERVLVFVVSDLAGRVTDRHTWQNGPLVPFRTLGQRLIPVPDKKGHTLPAASVERTYRLGD